MSENKIKLKFKRYIGITNLNEIRLLRIPEKLKKFLKTYFKTKLNSQIKKTKLNCLVGICMPVGLALIIIGTFLTTDTSILILLIIFGILFILIFPLYLIFKYKQYIDLINQSVADIKEYTNEALKLIPKTKKGRRIKIDDFYKDVAYFKLCIDSRKKKNPLKVSNLRKNSGDILIRSGEKSNNKSSVCIENDAEQFEFNTKEEKKDVNKLEKKSFPIPKKITNLEKNNVVAEKKNVDFFVGEFNKAEIVPKVKRKRKETADAIHGVCNDPKKSIKE